MAKSIVYIVSADHPSRKCHADPKVITTLGYADVNNEIRNPSTPDWEHHLQGMKK